MTVASSRSFWRLPACTALAVQIAAAVFVVPIFLATSLIGFQVPAVFFLLLQGLIATIMSRACRLARWWMYIQFLFPVTFWMVHSLGLPPGLFLAGFVFLSLLYWTTFRTQVPFYPSRRAVWRAVRGLLPPDRQISLLDAGSGIGGLILYLAQRRPDASFTGAEAAPLPWLISRIRNHAGSGNSRFILGDYNRLDFASYDVLFAYLSSAAMPALWQKARLEMRPGTLLLSYEFPIPETSPDIRVLPEADGPVLYGWHM